MAAGVIRNKKDGSGCSLCRASEQNVGKRRCCHVLDGAQIVVRKEKHARFIDISGQVDDEETTISIKATENKIKSYITSLSSGLSKKGKEDLLNELREV